DRTSIELPRALSGSNELMTWPGVASTWTNAAAVMSGAVCATAVRFWMPTTATIAATAPLSSLRFRSRFTKESNLRAIEVGIGVACYPRGDGPNHSIKPQLRGNPDGEGKHST